MTAELKYLCPACGADMPLLFDDKYYTCLYCGNNYNVHLNGDEMFFHLSSLDSIEQKPGTTAAFDLGGNPLADEIEELYAKRRALEDLAVPATGRVSGSVFFLGIIVLGISLIYKNLPGEIIGAGLLIYSLVEFIREEKKKRALQESIADVDRQISKRNKNANDTNSVNE